MFCGGKEKFFFKTKFSLPAFHLLLAFIKNAKTESSALNSINITRRSIDTRLFVIEKLRNLGRSEQPLGPILKSRLNNRRVKAGIFIVQI